MLPCSCQQLQLPVNTSDLRASRVEQGMTSTPLSRARPRTLQAQEAEETRDESAPAAGSSVQTVSGQEESPTIRPQPRPQVTTGDWLEGPVLRVHRVAGTWRL